MDLHALPAALRRRLSAVRQSDEPQVRRELLALGWRNMRLSVLSPAFVAATVIATYGSALPLRPLILWLAGMACASLAVVAVRRRLLAAVSSDTPAASAGVRPRVMVPLYAVAGLGWGSIALLLAPDAPIRNAVFVVIYVAVIAVGASNIGVHSVLAYRTMVVASCLIMLPLLPRGFGEGAFPLQAGMVFIILLLGAASRNVHETMARAVRLQFANDTLLAQKVAEAQRAERANREKSLFLAAASHDLRQPVHALLLLVEALRQRTTDAGARELVGYVQEAGATIGKLFSALMELSRLESGSEKPEIGPFDLESLLRGVAERHRHEAARLGLDLDLRLGRAAAGAWIHSDRVLLERILDNLVANALRYTPRGRVLVTARRTGDTAVRVQVRDTGIGISAADAERIFDPYFQAANPERDRRKGLGLGLAIVRSTALLLAHPLALASVPGRGSCFGIDLPLCDGGPAAQPAPAADPAVPRLEGRRVLVIDDDAMVLHAMEVLFTQWGLDWRCAAGEPEALALLTDGSWTPEVVLCDFRLRGPRNGIAVLEALGEAFPQAVGLLQTGELAPEVRDAAEDAGYLVLAKPVAAGTLARTLEAVLAQV